MPTVSYPPTIHPGEESGSVFWRLYCHKAFSFQVQDFVLVLIKFHVVPAGLSAYHCPSEW